MRDDSTRRLVARGLKITQTRPGKPGELAFNSDGNVLTWKKPSTGGPFTHYLVRIDADAGQPDFQLGAQEVSVVLTSGTWVSISAYNETMGWEGPKAFLEYTRGTAGTDWQKTITFDYPAEDPIQVEDNVSADHLQVRLLEGKRVQLHSVVLRTKENVTGDLVFDLKRSADGGATWATIFNSGDANKPRALDGTRTAPPVTTFAIEYLNVDDLIRPDVLAIGSNTVVSGAIFILGRQVAI